MKSILLVGGLLLVVHPIGFAQSEQKNTTTTTTLSQPVVNQPNTSTNTAPNSTTTTTTPPANTTIPTTSSHSMVTIPAHQTLDCNFHISPEITEIDEKIIMKWAEKAVQKSFDFDFSTVDKQLSDLKNCYTEQGWQSFNEALTRSKNLNVIQQQHLMMSSMVDGPGKVLEAKANIWKLKLPLQVVYQNDKEKITQSLYIRLTVGRKTNGDLGIMQIVGSLRNYEQE